MGQMKLYDDLVRYFRSVTSMKRDNGSCCKLVDGHGAPECCYQIVNGARLYFTEAEVPYVGFGLKLMPDGTYDVDRDQYDQDALRWALNDKWLANTLECAAHPLRPIVGMGNQVIGTVSVSCNTDIAFDLYRQKRDDIRAAWQTAVDLLGLKPYYATYYLMPEWRVL